MKFIHTLKNYSNQLQSMRSLPLLLMRLVLAYGFLNPAKMKWSDISSVASWFDSMGYPFPTFNAYMAAGTEALGVGLLALGLFTRLITLPLMFVMIIALSTVHWGHGFEAGNNGIEIPLYYLIMLFSLFIYGGGKWSLDNYIYKK